MASQIQIRRDTATNWASINPILAQGEFGYVLDSQEFKIKKGDGVTAWNSLSYIEFGDKALWGNIGGDITNQPDLMNYLQNLQSDIDDEASARESADQTLTNQYNSLNTAVSNIQAVIPNDATAQNQLADKSFVNSSIASSTANFIGTFNSVAEMEAYSGPLTNNDYAFVETTDTAGNTLYDRYKWNGSEWLFEYELNNSSFTADQWAAINSNATDSKIAQIATNATNITTLQGQVAGKQDTITDLETIRSNAQAGKNASDTIATYGNIVTHNVSEFATSTQGTKADSAIQGVQVNGTDLTKDVNNKVNIVLGTAAFASTTDFATAAQGEKADTALQPAAIANMATTNTAQDITAQKTFIQTSFTNGITVKRDGVYGAAIRFENSLGAIGFIGILPSGGPVWANSTNTVSKCIIVSGTATAPNVGNTSTPVYIDNDGVAQPCTLVQEKSIIQTLSATDSITLADNTIYNGGEQTALTIALPASVDVSFLCEVCFSSGYTATTLTYPQSGINWVGDDLSSNVFTPVASKRYTIICSYDGSNYLFVVKGV